MATLVLRDTKEPSSCLAQEQPRPQQTLPNRRLEILEDQLYSHNFHLDGNMITYKQPLTSYYSQLLINQSVPVNSVCIVKWRIIKTLDLGIFLGFTSRAYKHERVSHFLPHSASNFSKKKMVFPGKHKAQISFIEGDIIELTLDRAHNTFSWTVGGRKQVALVNTNFSKPEVEYVPFIQMFWPHDTIEFMGSQIRY